MRPRCLRRRRPWPGLWRCCSCMRRGTVRAQHCPERALLCLSGDKSDKSQTCATAPFRYVLARSAAPKSIFNARVCPSTCSRTLHRTSSQASLGAVWAENKALLTDCNFMVLLMVRVLRMPLEESSRSARVCCGCGVINECFRGRRRSAWASACSTRC